MSFTESLSSVVAPRKVIGMHRGGQICIVIAKNMRPAVRAMLDEGASITRLVNVALAEYLDRHVAAEHLARLANNAKPKANAKAH